MPHNIMFYLQVNANSKNSGCVSTLSPLKYVQRGFMIELQPLVKLFCHRWWFIKSNPRHGNLCSSKGGGTTSIFCGVRERTFDIFYGFHSPSALTQNNLRICASCRTHSFLSKFIEPWTFITIKFRESYDGNLCKLCKYVMFIK